MEYEILLINSIGYKIEFVNVFQFEKKGNKNAKATEVIGKYITFQKKGFWSIVKLSGIIPNIKKNKIPKPITAKTPFDFFQMESKLKEKQAAKTPIKIASIL